ncbi:DJ-1/PfpI family protein [Paenibacillus illinoisensis]|uniref:DJ-1/PfpI family protein n=1 Tax=Paenibacillus illinoisensis TaxID=59845 RepID=UPI001FE4BA76|nr:DJ-1/PfpI family protein [Paenibacillus illinoisensis]
MKAGVNINTHVLIYDGFVNFEIMLATYLMKTQGEIITVGLSSEMVNSYEGFTVKPHQNIKEINCDDVEVLLIPGGDISAIEGNQQLTSLIKGLDINQKYIGAICSGVEVVKQAGVLEAREFTSNRTNNAETYKVSRNIITAKANGYVDFAIELGKMLNIYSDEEDYNETVRYFKYFESN